jgi:sporulation protein YlmC with PRC-barrel domain
MEKQYSEILGTPVVIDEMPRPVGRVQDLIMDPESGNLVAFSVGQNRVIVPRDVIRLHRHLLIHDRDDICHSEDILRIGEIQKLGSGILKNKVETEEGDYIGKVFDYSVETKTNALKKIFVAKNFLGLLRIDERIIPKKHIVEILPGKIVIKGSTTKIPIKQLEENMIAEEEFSQV